MLTKESRTEKATGRVVAIKVVDVDDASEEIDDVLIEVSMLCQMRSQYITECYSVFLSHTEMWMVMELCDGGSCAELLKYLGPLSEDVIACIMRGSLLGLEYLHADMRIHRDVKAANILLTSQGQVKLSDFGVSSQLTNTLPHRRTFVGTPFWMAPEVIRREDGYATKADIWSLGITAFELAEAEPPHADMPPTKAIMHVVKARPAQLPHEQKQPKPLLAAIIAAADARWQQKQQQLQQQHQIFPYSSRFFGSSSNAQGKTAANNPLCSSKEAGTNWASGKLGFGLSIAGEGARGGSRATSMSVDGGVGSGETPLRHVYSDSFRQFVDACLVKDVSARASARDLLEMSFITRIPRRHLTGGVVAAAVARKARVKEEWQNYKNRSKMSKPGAEEANALRGPGQVMQKEVSGNSESNSERTQSSGTIKKPQRQDNDEEIDSDASSSMGSSSLSAVPENAQETQDDWIFDTIPDSDHENAITRYSPSTASQPVSGNDIPEGRATVTPLPLSSSSSEANATPGLRRGHLPTAVSTAAAAARNAFRSRSHNFSSSSRSSKHQQKAAQPKSKHLLAEINCAPPPKMERAPHLSYRAADEDDEGEENGTVKTRIKTPVRAKASHWHRSSVLPVVDASSTSPSNGNSNSGEVSENDVGTPNPVSGSPAEVNSSSATSASTTPTSGEDKRGSAAAKPKDLKKGHDGVTGVVGGGRKQRLLAASKKRLNYHRLSTKPQELPAVSAAPPVAITTAAISGVSSEAGSVLQHHQHHSKTRHRRRLALHRHERPASTPAVALRPAITAASSASSASSSSSRQSLATTTRLPSVVTQVLATLETTASTADTRLTVRLLRDALVQVESRAPTIVDAFVKQLWLVLKAIEEREWQQEQEQEQEQSLEELEEVEQEQDHDAVLGPKVSGPINVLI